jgi:hypothetical protein
MQTLVATINKKSVLVIILVNIISMMISLYSPWVAYVLFGVLGFYYLIREERVEFKLEFLNKDA